MKKTSLYSYLVLSTICFAHCTQKNEPKHETSTVSTIAEKTKIADLSKYNVATFAAGCFWCEEAVFESVKGVEEVISGYSGGTEENPNYERVGSGNTGHAESFEVYYDSTKITYSDLLKVYFASEDPTQVNGQGPDRGSQYRSIIFFRNQNEKELTDKFITELNQSKKYEKAIQVQVVPFVKFWPAEDYHQDYIQHNPGNSYVKNESIPRLKRTQLQVFDLIKPERSIIDK